MGIHVTTSIFFFLTRYSYAVQRLWHCCRLSVRGRLSFVTDILWLAVRA